jgi:hypothetical protein
MLILMEIRYDMMGRHLLGGETLVYGGSSNETAGAFLKQTTSPPSFHRPSASFRGACCNVIRGTKMPNGEWKRD